MANLLSPPSKIVFIVHALDACIAFFLGELDQNNFMLLAEPAFAFYFASTGEPSAPFAGKDMNRYQWMFVVCAF